MNQVKRNPFANLNLGEAFSQENLDKVFSREGLNKILVKRLDYLAFSIGLVFFVLGIFVRYMMEPGALALGSGVIAWAIRNRR